MGGLAVLLAVLGCQPQYRPVVSAENPVGPAQQPSKYAIAVSSPGATQPGLVNVIDFSGDTVLATQPIIVNPTYFAYQATSAQAIVINAGSGLTDIPNASVPTSFLPNLIQQTTLPSNANAPTVSSFTLGTAARILVPEVGRSAIAVLSTGTPALQQEIAVAPNPTFVVGVDGTPRAYALSAGNGTGNGVAAAIEGSTAANSITSLSISATIPVGVDPVYGVQTADLRRAFVLNHGSGTVSVINVTNNAPDNANPVIQVGQNPIWADLVAATNELVVLNQGNGTAPGSLSIINIPLCNAAAQPTNPSCDPANPVDGTGFGTVVATVPVGINPQVVSVLSDGTQAYVVNAGSAGNPNSGSVTIVNLITGVVTATIPAASAVTATGAPDPTGTPTCPDGSVLTCIYGIPNTVAATTGTPTGKVYITSGNSNYLTVLETDTNSVVTHINLQGAGVRVRVTAP